MEILKGILYKFSEFFWDVWLEGSDLGIIVNSLGILSEFYWNSLGTLLKFFRDVWLGGSKFVGVDFG